LKEGKRRIYSGKIVTYMSFCGFAMVPFFSFKKKERKMRRKKRFE